jgi:peptidoglycan-N-acetylglucosamine deacetylase
MRFAKLIFAILALMMPPSAQAGGKLEWPGGRKAAIVLTYDDSLKSALHVAFPQLTEAGLTGTFFLNATFDAADLPRWRALSAAGNELGNHSAFHPCPAAAFAMEPQYRAENYSVAGMLREISAMNTFLAAIDGARPRTYSVPCSQMLMGGKDYTEALRTSGLIRYVRTGVPDGGVIADPRAMDPFRVPSRSFSETSTAEDMIAFVKQVERSGGMGVFMFHGVGGDYLSVTAEAHRGLLRYLREHRAEIWTAPFQQVMDHVHGRHSEKLTPN